MKRILVTLALTAFASVAGAQSIYYNYATPVPGPSDIYQLSEAGANPAGPGGNNSFSYFDNDSYNSGSGAAGQTFVTGSNPGGYILQTVVHQAGYDGLLNTGPTGIQNSDAYAQYQVIVYQLWDGITLGDADSITYPTNIYSVVGSNLTAAAPFNSFPLPGAWVTISGLSIPLAANTAYAYTITDIPNQTGAGSYYAPMNYTGSASYMGSATPGVKTAGVGTIMRALVPTVTQGGGAPGTGLASGPNTNFVYSTTAGTGFLPTAGGGATAAVLGSDPFAAVFDLGLMPYTTGEPLLSGTSASINPASMGGAVTVSATDGQAETSVTYQWYTNSDLTGALGGTWGAVTKATNLSYSFMAPNLNAYGSNYYIDLQLKAVNGTATVTNATYVLQVTPGALPVGAGITITETASAPTPGPNDIYNLSDAGALATGLGGNNSFNYMDNNSISASSGASGQIFVTGNNGTGYTLGALTWKSGYDSTSTIYGSAATSNEYRVMVYQLATNIISGTNYPTNIYAVVGSNITTAAPFFREPLTNYWLTISGLAVPLLPNTAYAWTVCDVNTTWYSPIDYTASAVYMGPATGSQSGLIGGLIRARVPTVTQTATGATGTGVASGALTQFTYPTYAGTGFVPSGNFTNNTVSFLQSNRWAAEFDLSLSLNTGAPNITGLAAYLQPGYEGTPNPVFALTPEILTAIDATPNDLATYQWYTNSDTTGAQGGFWGAIPGATNLSFFYAAPNLYPSTVPNANGYVLDLQVQANNISGSSTSPTYALTVSNAVAPVINYRPGNASVYAGASLTIAENFVLGNGPVTSSLYWSSTPTLTGGSTLINQTVPGQLLSYTVTNLQAATNGYFLVVASNYVGQSVSNIPISIVSAPAANTFASAILTAGYGAVAYWPLNDLTNPTNNNPYAYAQDLIGGFYGVYGTNSFNGGSSPAISGPQPSQGYSGMASGAGALQAVANVANNQGGSGGVYTYASPALTGASQTNMTMLAWVNPFNPVGQPGDTNGAIMFWRSTPSGGAGTTSGFWLSTQTGTNLGYDWAGNATSTAFTGGPAVPGGSWSMVALVMSGTNQYLWVCNPTNGALVGWQTNFVPGAETFGGAMTIGGDPNTLARWFNGYIADAVMFSNALTTNQILSLYEAGLVGAKPLPNASASPDPVEAKSLNEVLTGTVTGTVIGTPTWYTNNDVNEPPGVWPSGTWTAAGTGLSLPFVPADLNPNAIPFSSSYNIQFELVAGNTFGLATSAPVSLIVSNASVPSINYTPTSQTLYVGGSATFSETFFAGTTPITNAWYVSTSPAGPFTLLASNIGANLSVSYTAASAGTYYISLAASNNIGSTISNVQVTVLAVPAANTFASNVVAGGMGAAAYWPLNENSNNPSLGGVVAYDLIGGFNGVYGTATTNGGGSAAGPTPIANGPQPPGQTGFPAANTGFGPGTQPATGIPATGVPTGVVLTSATPTFTKTNATLLAWIFPTVPQSTSLPESIMITRSTTATATNSAGMGYLSSGSAQNEYNYSQGEGSNIEYNWGSSGSIYGYNTTNPIPVGIWSMVAIVVTPSNITSWVCNTNVGLSANVQTIAVPLQTFGGPLDIGGDSLNTSWQFLGDISSAVIFTNSLTTNQIGTLFAAGIAKGNLPPIIQSQPPASIEIIAGNPLSLTVNASVIGATTYQWYSNGVALANGTGGYSGLGTPNLVVSNAVGGTQFKLTITDSLGAVTTVPSLVTTPVSATTAYGASTYAQAITNLNPIAYWRFNEAAVHAANAWDFWGGHTAAIGTNVATDFGNTGGSVPTLNDGASGFTDSGFESGNVGEWFTNSTEFNNIGIIAPDSYDTVPALGLNTNAVSITMWVYPNTGETEKNQTGLFTTGTDGIFYTTNGDGSIGFGWNGAAHNSTGLVLPGGQWSFVALTISASDAVLYAYNSSSQLLTNVSGSYGSDAFNTVSEIGDYLGETNLQFDGLIDEVAIFNQTLSGNTINTLWNVGSGLTVTPSIEQLVGPTTPVYFNVNATNVVLTVIANGVGLGYQWAYSNSTTSGSFVNLQNGLGTSFAGTLITGVTSNTITISNYPVPLAQGLLQVQVSSSGFSTLTTNFSPTVFPLPALWTAGFKITNGGPFGYTAAQGTDIAYPFTNYGIIGNGTFWNPLISPGDTNILAVGSGGATITWTNQTALDVTHTAQPGLSSMIVNIPGQGYAGPITAGHELMDVWLQAPGNLTITTQPGWYSMFFYSMDGGSDWGQYNPPNGGGGFFGFDGVGAGVARNDDGVIANGPDLAYVLGVNTAIVTNVYTTNGVIVIPANLGTNSVGNTPNIEMFNGFQIQLVMPISITAALTTTNTVAITYSGGDLYSSPTLPNPTWTQVAGSAVAQGTVVVPITNGSHNFYELQVDDGYSVGGSTPTP